MVFTPVFSQIELDLHFLSRLACVTSGEGKIPTTLTRPCHTSNGHAGMQIHLNASQILQLLVASLHASGRRIDSVVSVVIFRSSGSRLAGSVKVCKAFTTPSVNSRFTSGLFSFIKIVNIYVFK